MIKNTLKIRVIGFSGIEIKIGYLVAGSKSYCHYLVVIVYLTPTSVRASSISSMKE